MKKMEEIPAYLRIFPWLHSAGQPSEEQLKGLGVLRSLGIETVINLALPGSEGAVRDEGAVLAEQGIVYLNIPVDFQAPRAEEFFLFREFLDSLNRSPVLIHCAKNMRASAFIYLYRVLPGVSEEEENAAREDMRKIWEPDKIWSAFIEDLKSLRPSVPRGKR